MKYDSIIIGHITMDINTDSDGVTVNQEGGAVLYSSASAFALGHRVAAVTKLPERDKGRLNALKLDKEDVFCTYCDSPSNMVNIYLTPDRERRNSTCSSVGTPFCANDLPDAETEIYHFAGLVFGDFDGGLIKAAAEKAKVAVDVQGFLRHVNRESGKMFFEDWAEKKELLPYIHFLKTDAAEAEILTGTADRKKAAEIMYSWGAKEIVITHNTEVLVYDGRSFYTCPIRARNLSGRTGRGDTTFAAYICERLTKDIPSSLLTATATVSLKMETPGPFGGKREDVDRYINEFYSDII